MCECVHSNNKEGLVEEDISNYRRFIRVRRWIAIVIVVVVVEVVIVHSNVPIISSISLNRCIVFFFYYTFVWWSSWSYGIVGICLHISSFTRETKSEKESKWMNEYERKRYEWKNYDGKQLISSLFSSMLWAIYRIVHTKLNDEWLLLFHIYINNINTHSQWKMKWMMPRSLLNILENYDGEDEDEDDDDSRSAKNGS